MLGDPHCQSKVWFEMKGCNYKQQVIYKRELQMIKMEVKQKVIYKLSLYYLQCNLLKEEF